MSNPANKRSTTDSPPEELLSPGGTLAKKAKTSDLLEEDPMDVDMPLSPTLSDTKNNDEPPSAEETHQSIIVTHTPHTHATQPNPAAITQLPPGKDNLSSGKVDLKEQLEQLSEQYLSVYYENANPFTSTEIVVP